MPHLTTYKSAISAGESAIVVHHTLRDGHTVGLHLNHRQRSGWTERWITDPVRAQPDRIVIFEKLPGTKKHQVWVGRFTRAAQVSHEGRKKWRYHFSEVECVGESDSSWRDFVQGETSYGSEFVARPARAVAGRVSGAADLPPVLFARIGDMRLYRGPSSADEKPSGAGSYNQSMIGHECYNFAAVDGRCFGYVQPSVKKGGDILASTIALQRIVPGCIAETVGGVTVIFFTKRKGEHPEIVGWYRNATVHRFPRRPTPKLARRRPDPNGEFPGCLFNMEADASDAVLLPRANRIPLHRGEGARTNKPGKANVFYLYEDAKGNAREMGGPDNAWISNVIRFTKDYRGANLIASPELDALDSIADELDAVTAEAEGRGQKFARNAQFRKAVELHAMKAATRHFSRNYQVKDVSANRSYDLECTPRSGAGSVLRVEVKGTVSAGDSVFLTANEVKSARRHLSALFVLHSIAVDERNGEFVARGGKPACLNPWKPAEDRLTPLVFKYTPDYEE